MACVDDDAILIGVVARKPPRSAAGHIFWKLEKLFSGGLIMGGRRDSRDEGGQWMTAAVPGRGICRVWVPDQEPIDLAREAADEILRALWAVYEMSVAANGYRDEVLTDGQPTPVVAQSDDPGQSFLSGIFGRRGGA
jgi:hypothetical protein